MVRLVSVLQPHHKMLVSISSYLSNFLLQKKQTHVVSVVHCPAPLVSAEKLHQQMLEHMQKHH